MEKCIIAGLSLYGGWVPGEEKYQVLKLPSCKHVGLLSVFAGH